MSATHPGRVAAATLAALVVAAGGAVAGVMLTAAPTADSLASPAPTTTVEVTTRPYDDARNIDLRPVASDGRALTAAASGTITATRCVVGDELSSGDQLVAVDGRPVVALATTMPLWRDLALGARGADVTALNEELRRLGHPAGQGDRFDAATRDGVRALLANAGASSPDGTLPLAHVAWLPSRTTTLGACEHRLGDRTDGGRLATAGGGVVALQAAMLPPNARHGDRVVTVAGVRTYLGEDGQVTDREALDAWFASPEGFAWRNLGDDAPATTVTWELAQPLETAVVPPGALAGADGPRPCLATPDGARAVEIVGSGLGKSYVQMLDGTPPSHVLARAVPGTTC